MRCPQVLVVLCAVGAASSHPIALQGEGGEVLKSGDHSEESLKTICIRYKENQPTETNQVKDDNYPWLMIRLGKSQPKVINYKILTMDESGERTVLDDKKIIGDNLGSRTKLINSNLTEEGLASPQHNSSNEQRIKGKTIPERSQSNGIGVITSIDTNCSSSSENTTLGDRQVISVLNSTAINNTSSVNNTSTMFNNTGNSRSGNSTEANTANAMTYSDNSFSNKTNNTGFGESKQLEHASSNVTNTLSNSTEKNLIHPEIVTDSLGRVVDVISIEEDSGPTTEGFSLTEPEDHYSEQVAKNSADGSDEGSNNSTELGQNPKDTTFSRTRESAVIAASVSKSGPRNSNVNTFPPDIVTNSYGEVIDVLSEEEYAPPRARESSVNATNASNFELETWNSNSTVPPGVIVNKEGFGIKVIPEENTDNSTIDYEYETESSNGTDSSGDPEIRSQILDKNIKNVTETGDFESSNTTEDTSNFTDENDTSTLTTVDATSPFTNTSDDEIDRRMENVTEDARVFVMNEDNGQSTLTTLETTVESSTKSNSSDDQINNRIENSPIETSSVVMSTTDAFRATTNSMIEEDGFKSEPGTTPELSSTTGSITKSQEVETFTANLTLEQTTPWEEVPTESTTEVTGNQQLVTTTPKPFEDSFRLEPSTAILTSTVRAYTEEETIQTQSSLSSSSPPPASAAADSLITPSTGHSPSEPIQRLLPIPTTPPPDWEKFNNFTIIFPTRTALLVRPHYYNPYEQGFYYMPLDPRYIRPGEFLPYP